MTKKTTSKIRSPSERRIIVETHGKNAEQLRITIPTSFRITYGPCTPKGSMNGSMYVRIYDKTKLVGVIPNVYWLRDENIPFEKRIRTKDGQFKPDTSWVQLSEWELLGTDDDGEVLF